MTSPPAPPTPPGDNPPPIPTWVAGAVLFPALAGPVLLPMFGLPAVTLLSLLCVGLAFRAAARARSRTPPRS